MEMGEMGEMEGRGVEVLFLAREEMEEGDKGQEKGEMGGQVMELGMEEMGEMGEMVARLLGIPVEREKEGLGEKEVLEGPKGTRELMVPREMMELVFVKLEPSDSFFRELVGFGVTQLMRDPPHKGWLNRRPI